MADFAGTLLPAVLIATAPPGITPDLSQVTTPASFGTHAALAPLAGPGTRTVRGPIAIAPARQLGGAVTPAVADGGASVSERRLDRIHVRVVSSAFGQPNVADLGALLSTVVLTVEVWNSLDTAQVLSSILQTGGAGVTLADPFGVPTAYGARQARTYTLTVAQIGAPTIDNTLRFDFAGLDEPTLVLLGARLIPLTVRPSGPVEDAQVWRTRLVTTRDGSEQRARLRDVPRRRLRYGVVAAEERDAQLLAQQLYGATGFLLAVPLWMQASRLTAPVAAGAGSVACATADRDFAVGTSALLYRDPQTWESVTITGVTAGGVTVSPPVVGAWPAQTTALIPYRIGRLPSEAGLGRPGRGVATASVELETLPDASLPSGTPGFVTTYRGLPVLGLEPDGAQRATTFQTTARVLDAQVGRFTLREQTGVPRERRELRFLAQGRPAITALRQFAATVARGRLGAFWLPSWRRDLTLATAAAAGSTTLTITRCDYTRWGFAAGATRRHLVALSPSPSGPALTPCSVANATLGATTETLTLTSGLGTTLAAGAGLAVLSLVRCDTDELVLRYLGSATVAELVLSVIDLPRETPTP